MSPSRSPSARETPETTLKRWFREHGYVRTANLKLRQKLGQGYKKGYEVRLVVSTRGELALIRRLLRQVGLNPGKPFPKHRQIVQPIYGQAAVKWFTARKAAKKR